MASTTEKSIDKCPACYFGETDCHAYTETNDDNFEPIDIGGAGIMNVGNFAMSNSEVVDNIGDCDFGFGVGIYAVSAEEMSDNEPSEDDDYPWLNGAFTITGSTISGNGCVWSTGTPSYARYMNGGGIAVIGLKPTVSNTAISSNDALIGGGAIIYYAYDENDLEPLEDPTAYFSGVTVSYNTSKMAGGGIAMIGPGGVGDDDFVVPATVKSKLQIENCIVDQSVVQSAISHNSSCYGGGVTVFSVEMTVTGNTLVQYNTANSSYYTAETGDGLPSWDCAGAGVLLVRRTKLFWLTGSMLFNSTVATGNKEGAGAGIYADTLASLSISGGTVKSNSATYGGGIYNAGAMTMSGGVIGKVNDDDLQNDIESSNTATSGAGIYVTGTASLTGGSISQNEADEYGGGLYIDSTGSVTNSGCDISYNIAYLGGGGVYVEQDGSYTEINPPQPDGYCHDNEIDDISDENNP